MTPATRSREARAKRVRDADPEPIWIGTAVLYAMHDAVIREFGGRGGVRNEGLLDAAMNRPRNKHAYGERDLSVLAAAYAFGLATNHGFVDGNKRVAFVAAALFLRLNGHELAALEPEVVDIMNRLASGKLTEAALGAWIRAHVSRLPREKD